MAGTTQQEVSGPAWASGPSVNRETVGVVPAPTCLDWPVHLGGRAPSRPAQVGEVAGGRGSPGPRALAETEAQAAALAAVLGLG